MEKARFNCLFLKELCAASPALVHAHMYGNWDITTQQGVHPKFPSFPAKPLHPLVAKRGVLRLLLYAPRK